MRRILVLLFLLFPSISFAQNYTATPGTGLTFGSKLNAGVNYPQMTMCDPTTPAQCMSIDASGRPTVNINGTVTVTGTIAATQSGIWTVQPGNTANTVAWLVTGTGGTFPVTQATAANLNATVVPSTLAAWGLTASTQNSATPTNSQLVNCQFNTAPTTITSGNTSPIQCNNAGAVNVAIVSGGGSGGTASSFAAAFPATGTAVGFSDGTNMQAGRVTTYGTAPTGLNALAVNAFVTNTNANGSATSANSAPIVIASDQAAVAVKGNAANGSAVSGNPNLVAGSDGANVRTVLTDTSGRVQTSADPCETSLKSFAPISLTASGQVITGTASKKTYICSINLISATAQNIALVEGTGTTCATNIFGLAGGTTAATGWNLAANTGFGQGNGSGTIIQGSGDANATAANLCLLLSSTGQTSGTIGYVQQ